MPTSLTWTHQRQHWTALEPSQRWRENVRSTCRDWGLFEWPFPEGKFVRNSICMLPSNYSHHRSRQRWTLDVRSDIFLFAAASYAAPPNQPRQMGSHRWLSICPGHWAWFWENARLVLLCGKHLHRRNQGARIEHGPTIQWMVWSLSERSPTKTTRCSGRAFPLTPLDEQPWPEKTMPKRQASTTLMQTYG